MCPPLTPGRGRVTIKVLAGPPRTLDYDVTFPTILPVPTNKKKHRHPKNTDFEWCCNDGDYAIQFYKKVTGVPGNRKSPFTSNLDQFSALSGNVTPVQTTKNLTSLKKFQYVVAVASPGFPILIEDPDFETGGGGGGPTLKKSSKKPAKKSKKKKKK